MVPLMLGCFAVSFCVTSLAGKDPNPRRLGGNKKRSDKHPDMSSKILLTEHSRLLRLNIAMNIITMEC